MSGYAPADSVETLSTDEDVAWLQKPFTGAELTEAVARATGI